MCYDSKANQCVDHAATLLLKAVKQWRLHHDAPPANAAERRAFKESIQQWQRSIEGIPLEEDNFQVGMLHWYV
jgi:hypothetical protein